MIPWRGVGKRLSPATKERLGVSPHPTMFSRITDPKRTFLKSFGVNNRDPDELNRLRVITRVQNTIPHLIVLYPNSASRSLQKTKHSQACGSTRLLIPCQRVYMVFDIQMGDNNGLINRMAPLFQCRDVLFIRMTRNHIYPLKGRCTS